MKVSHNLCGCSQDKCTREAAAQGLAVYAHLLQLSADRSLLCHFAEVHEHKMQFRKRFKKLDSRSARRADVQQRHKTATFAFREIRQLLTLLVALRASIYPQQLERADETGNKSQVNGGFQVH